jgi:uncharacterized protein (TIGR02246 family)
VSIVRIKHLAAALVVLAGLTTASCESIRDRIGLGKDEEPVAEAVDPETFNAEARRILQTRSFENLRASVREAETEAVRAVLAGQVAAWNRGDIDAFMASYWQSPDLRFASGSTPVRGWAQALRRYRRSYPDRNDMGELTLSDLRIDLLSPDAATVFGRWRLAQVSETPTGLFTLVLRKMDGRWLIVHDHTTGG